jgi:hypothetical protein
LISKKPSKSPVEVPCFTLEYCKLKEPIDAAPAGKDGKFNKNVKAMVQSLKVKNFWIPLLAKEPFISWTKQVSMPR